MDHEIHKKFGAKMCKNYADDSYFLNTGVTNLRSMGWL